MITLIRSLRRRPLGLLVGAAINIGGATALLAQLH